MKLDSDPPHHSTTSRKSVPKSCECDYKSLELQNQAFEENQIRLSGEGKMNQKDANESPYSTGDGNDCMTTDINRSYIEDFEKIADGIRSFVAPSSKTPSDSYVDISVMECGLSKTIICYKEINVNDVKDICVDEGVPSLDNIFFGSMDEKPVCKILLPEDDRDEGLIKEQENSSEVSKSVADDLKFSVEDHFSSDLTIHDDSKDLKQIEKVKFNVSDPELPMPEKARKSCSLEALDNVCNEVEITGVQISGEKANLEDPASVSKAVEFLNGNSDLQSGTELPNDKNLTNSFTYNSEVEKGSITFNFNSFSPGINGGEERHENSNLNDTTTEECCQSSDSAIETRVSTNPVAGTSNTRLVSIHTQHDVGESSFSAVDPLASLVNHSGPIAYSGSLSLRSESSAASARSFAFPILQSEWNSSPVKMAKAEPRHYRKYRGWREGFLCCRF